MNDFSALEKRRKIFAILKENVRVTESINVLPFCQWISHFSLVLLFLAIKSYHVQDVQWAEIPIW